MHNRGAGYNVTLVSSSCYRIYRERSQGVKYAVDSATGSNHHRRYWQQVGAMTTWPSCPAAYQPTPQPAAHRTSSQLSQHLHCRERLVQPRTFPTSCLKHQMLCCMACLALNSTITQLYCYHTYHSYHCSQVWQLLPVHAGNPKSRIPVVGPFHMMGHQCLWWSGRGPVSVHPALTTR